MEIAFQTNIFGEIEPLGVSIDEAAKEVGVSTATIRNWVKTGYLQTINKNVTRNSLTTFVSTIVGKEKLNTRANKSQKDNHNHNELSVAIFERLTADNQDDTLWQVYENSLSESHRNKEGIYYTPADIVADMLLDFPEDLSDKLFLDPCCGGGNFIMQALAVGFKPENIYGFDTDQNAIEITKKRIFDKTGCRTDNIQQGDFLAKAKSLSLKFDYVFTNPPWGKKISKEAKEQYARLYNAGKSIDTCSLFFFASLSCLNQGGKLGFLQPEAFFNIATFCDARNYALNLTIERLIDYGKPFKGLVTKAQAIVLSNHKNPENKPIKCETTSSIHFRSPSSFTALPKTILNFWLNEESAEVISQVFGMNHITLDGNAEWGLGIVTGNNEKFCQPTPVEEGYLPVYKGSDILTNGLKEPCTFIPPNLTFYQQVAPQRLYEAPEKLIYKFISSKLCFYFDTEQKYILNSANMLILKKHFPINGQQLVAFLNSNFVNWLFQNIFNTHKILRGDLETIPIHTDYFKNNPIFDENTYLDFLNIEADNGTYRLKK